VHGLRGQTVFSELEGVLSGEVESISSVTLGGKNKSGVGSGALRECLEITESCLSDGT